MENGFTQGADEHNSRASVQQKYARRLNRWAVA